MLWDSSFLVRKGYLSSITAKKKVVAYKIGEVLPVPQSCFESGPVGFLYMLQIWFRYYLNDHVLQKMSELESTDGLFRLGTDDRKADGDGNAEFLAPHQEGNCVSSDGKFRFMADRP